MWWGSWRISNWCLAYLDECPISKTKSTVGSKLAVRILTKQQLLHLIYEKLHTWKSCRWENLKCSQEKCVVLGSSFTRCTRTSGRQALYVTLLTLMEHTYLLVSTKSNNAGNWTDLKYRRTANCICILVAITWVIMTIWSIEFQYALFSPSQDNRHNFAVSGKRMFHKNGNSLQILKSWPCLNHEVLTADVDWMRIWSKEFLKTTHCQIFWKKTNMQIFISHLIFQLRWNHRQKFQL